MSAPILEVSTRGQTRYIPGDPTPAPQTAMVRIDPDSVVRSAIDAQSAAVRDYMKGIAAQRTVDPAVPQRAPTGYSNDSELKARNQRFYFTVTGYILLAATVAWGIVSLAHLAGAIDGTWHWPLWLAATGGLALYLVKATHSLEAHLTPEGIEATRADADAYATEKAADGQHAIATAVAQAIEWRAQSEYADSQARLAATEAAYERILPQRQLPDNRRFAVQWQQEDTAVYATSIDVQPLQPATAPQRSDRWTCAPVQPDTACLALCAEIQRLYADCGQRGDDLVTTRLPWSQRGDWAAPLKRTSTAVLSQLDPPLLVAGDGGRWRLNRAAWPMPLALSAIRRRWPRD